MTDSAPQAVSPLSWVDGALHRAVARVVSTAPEPADPLRGLYLTDEAALSAAARLAGEEHEQGFARIVAALGVSEPTDQTILALCAAPELAADYGRLIGYLHDDLSRRRMTPRLIRMLVAADGSSELGTYVLTRLSADAPLRRDGAVTVVDDGSHQPLIDRSLMLDPALVAILLGADLAGGLRPRVFERLGTSPGREDVVAHLRAVLQHELQAPLGIVGPDAEAVLAEAIGGSFVILAANDLPDGRLRARARLEARLRGRCPIVVAELAQLDDDRGGAFRAALCSAGPNLLVAGGLGELRAALRDSVPVHVVEVPPLTPSERRACWTAALPDAEIGDAAERLPLSATQVGSVSAVLAQRARARGERIGERDLLDGGRELIGHELGPLAVRLEPGPTWDALVLPQRDLQLLRRIPAAVRYRDKVMDEWGFASVTHQVAGVAALFAGESGTGKTLAARIIARDLGLEAYRVDLAAIVSKYIGETEKNLDRIFSAAAAADAVLIFDEADALFGKRSAVTDARDRYANLEVAFLLQRLEEHGGVVILTTNLRQNIDSAFLRRLAFNLEFPVPDTAARAELWRRHLPGSAPLARNLDLLELARRHDLSGGAIANCTLTAAFSAAADGEVITTEHLAHAVALELRKLGRLSSRLTPATSRE